MNIAKTNVAFNVKETQKTSLLGLYLQLTKPRLLCMVLVSTMVGYLLQSMESWARFLTMLLATSFVGGGAMAINEYMECESDAKMRRTENRPIPAGEISARNALLFGLGISFVGFFIFSVYINFLSMLMALSTSVIYLLIYTPLKKMTSFATFIGAISGALPPLIGWTAAGGIINHQALILFMILFFWQIPHFLSIDWMYRADYLRAGFKTLSVLDPNGSMVARQMIANMSALFCASLLPTIFQITGTVYFFTAFILGSLFSGVIVYSLSNLNERARLVLRASVIYLPLLLLFMMIDKVR